MYNTTTVFTPCDFRDEDRMFLEGMHLVEEAYNEYQPMSFFEEYITEAFGKKKAGSGKGDTPFLLAAQEAKEPSQPTNTASEAKARKGILKLIDAVLGMIQKIKDTVSDFIARRRLSETERKAFEQFKEMMKKDPAMANKKVRVRDFKEIQRRYQQFMAECEKEYEAVAKNADHPIDKLLEKGKNWVTRNTKGVFQSVNAVGLINIAGTNKETAQMVYAVLKSDERLMNEMRKSMGEKGFKKWEKDMKSLTKRISIKRMKMKVTNQYFDDYVSAYAGAYQSLFNLKDGVNVKDGTQMDVLNYIRLNQNTADTVDGVVDLGVSAAKGYVKGAADKLKDNVYRATHGGEHRVPKKMSKIGIIKQGFKKPSFAPVSGSGFRKK